MIGAMIIFTRLINPSPRGFNPFPKPGFKYPTPIPRNTAIRTWTYKIRYHGLRRADTWMGGFVMGKPFYSKLPFSYQSVQHSNSVSVGRGSRLRPCYPLLRRTRRGAIVPRPRNDGGRPSRGRSVPPCAPVASRAAARTERLD